MVQLHHHKNSAAELILILFSLIVKETTYNEGLELAHLLIHIRFPIPISSDIVAFHKIARLFFEFGRATPEISGLFSTLEKNLNEVYEIYDKGNTVIGFKDISGILGAIIEY